MNIKRIILITAILILLPFTIKARGGDFGQAQSLFSDIKAHRTGDILTVNIYENTQATNKSESKTEKAGKFETSGGPGTGILDFIPLFGAKGENKNSFNGKGENLRNRNLRAKMSVTVVGVRENGDLIIEGTRTVGISNDRETLTLSGIVRKRDVNPDNSIESYLIADAQISYRGKGPINSASRPGPIMRFLNWLF
ncbi:MAG: flagellar basal body L-ring protein FlgH [candidate division Zixibacteria bacterium]|nr:flagellar basal body L-ring protein FlgH [candidate division Zixibacteria bacterium]